MMQRDGHSSTGTCQKCEEALWGESMIDNQMDSEEEIRQLKARLEELESRPPPLRTYGGGGTIHQTGFLDVETHQGRVVSVWFRCIRLPFEQTEVLRGRAEEMDSLGTGVTVDGINYRHRYN